MEGKEPAVDRRVPSNMSCCDAEGALECIDES